MEDHGSVSAILHSSSQSYRGRGVDSGGRDGICARRRIGLCHEWASQRYSLVSNSTTPSLALAKMATAVSPFPVMK